MNQEKFLKILRKELEGYLPKEDIDEIVSDHREFFQVGLSEGSGEEDVAKNLGDPAKIALSLMKKEEKPTKVPVRLRFLAFGVDLLFGALPFVLVAPYYSVVGFFVPNVFSIFIGAILSTIQHSSHSFIASARLFWKVGAIFGALWFLLLDALSLKLFKGQTLGKWLFGLKVVSDKEGGSVRLGQCVTRELVGKLLLNGLMASLWLPLGFLPSLVSLAWNLYSPKGSTLWDSFAGTRVLQVPPMGGRGRPWMRS